MLISKKMAAIANSAGTVRKMFEEGARMKAMHGPENVYDFSIGNPDVPPPPAFKEALIRLAQSQIPGMHGYMPNTGWPQIRAKVAEQLTSEQGAKLSNPFTTMEVIMTCGAAGALNTILKAILDPGDEIITPRPYFLEYGHYTDNHGGRLIVAEPGEGFHLNLEDIDRKITPATRAVLINSPHNPTGTIYTEAELAALGQLLTEAGKRHGQTIFLISDEPYRKLAYDGNTVPSVFAAYPYTIVATSYSKDLSLPGERIGYLAINPDMPDHQILFETLAVANRILGYVNAPSLMQLVLGEIQGLSVDVDIYERRRNIFVKGLTALGYEMITPEGAFYLFPKSPIADDMAFVGILKEEKILGVPGSVFMAPGYFRLCYCVGEETITNSLPAFAKAMEKAKA